jgi:FlaA1/EpsC-like NDP-sugar epimerase
MVEANLCAGVGNNVEATRAVIEAARQASIKHLTLISTDKAVRPTNAMGASKRVCELLIQSAAGEIAAIGSGPVLAMVRFGNVLGSSGSVIPLFHRQIASGGPVTVTHPAITRYFMTIPEAVQLVLQASGMARGGELFLLDMGDPVRIADLARQMIELSGLRVRDEHNPDGDIAIQYTGLRPGEKLYEELLINNDDYPTQHPLIRRANEPMHPSQCVPADAAQLHPST